ncbi:uncharacterized protein LOC121051526 [Rosa chinensis]|uniref:uncharacterized protein LOC121051526 n=1 Tax=Rosa chinensis TaxID=74649 RepID=UPI001AD8AF4A|nr:uncharacterized protein LOC121051526 [Rosa chinensis]
MSNYDDNVDFNYENIDLDNVNQSQLRNNVAFDDSETQDVGGLYIAQVEVNKNVETNVSCTKKSRGSNIIHRGEDGVRERIKWDKFGAPLWPRKKCAQFSNFVGSLAADGGFYPVSITDWHHLKSESHKKARERVKGTIDWANPHTASRRSAIKSYIFKRLQDCWKHHKSHLKQKYWLPNQGKAERCNCNLEFVHKIQWKEFVEYLDEEDTHVMEILVKVM